MLRNQGKKNSNFSQKLRIFYDESNIRFLKNREVPVRRVSCSAGVNCRGRAVQLDSDHAHDPRAHGLRVHGRQ